MNANGLECVSTRFDLAASLASLRKSSSFRSIGFVPTMGALHQGHCKLIEQAAKENSHVVVSIFVNPKQFGPKEDFADYPRTLEADCELAQRAGACLVFAPTSIDMYPQGFSTEVKVPDLSSVLCGKSRPGHFDGVCTVVLLLLNLMQADRVYFGQKDFQQVAIIKRLCGDIAHPTTIQVVPTHRDPDGLAASSRNVYLNSEGRAVALTIPHALRRVGQAFYDDKVRSAGKLTEHLIAALAHSRLTLDYALIVDRDSLLPVSGHFDNGVVVVAAWVEPFGRQSKRVRLIDNLILEVGRRDHFGPLSSFG